MFEKVPAQVSFPAEEEAIVAYWRDAQIFEQSLTQRRGGPEYVFYDGPPFATGLPHYGHLLAGTIKDVLPRYQTMRGYYVDRVFGWDCHGLPVEYEMEQELGITGKAEIESYGVGKFNEACRSIVLRYTAEWERVVQRMGRWVDFKNGYRTMDRDYMESIWWVFKTLWDKDLIYEGQKILPYCPRCATPLSNFEANLAYQSVADPSITVRFKLRGEDHRWFLAWTTTPWTLPSNLALTVGEEIEYVEVDDGGQHFILAAERLGVYYPADQLPPVVNRCRGKDLVGLTYEPLFPYFEALRQDGAFKVIAGDFVTTDAGTGLVHTAPGFGEDDARVAKVAGVPVVCPVDAACCFTEEIADYQGRFVKDCDKDLIKRLKDEGKLIHRSNEQHDYPHCWRCEAPLIYRAVSTWFVSIEKIKSRMLAANQQIHWVPEHLKDGRFGKWLENAHDWAISRNRYWGCPLPIWRNEETGEAVCIGSTAELQQLSGRAFDDIHKHFVDEVVLTAASGAELHRVPEVLDCWFESGSMPYAQRHYPFAHRDWLEANFPADFIAEGLDQTRGWFYTLVVLGAALFDKPAFKNVVVNGLILAEDGEKMSKRKKNYPDPEKIMNEYGADALRLCLLQSPVVRGEDLRFSEHGVREVMRGVLLPLWNAYSFFVTYARVDDWCPAAGVSDLVNDLENPLDQWILSRLDATVEQVTTAMEAYDLQAAATSFEALIDQLTNWYIRRSRRRFWKSADDADKNQAYSTLYQVLLQLCRTAAPFIPFLTERIHRSLRTEAMPVSVHLCDFPRTDCSLRRPQLDQRMANAMTAVSLGHFLRRQAEQRVRQPLRSAVLVSMDAAVRQDLEAMSPVIAEELNVKTVAVEANEEDLVHLSAKANFKKLGPRLGKKMKLAAAAIAELGAGQIADLRQGQALTLALGDGEAFDVSLDDIEIRREEKPGMAVANEGAITIALDLNLDDDLIAEGFAREFVKGLQNLRKECAFDVADRIEVRYHLPAELMPAFDQFQAYIAGETLAERVIADPELAAAGLEPIQIGSHSCFFALTRTG